LTNRFLFTLRGILCPPSKIYILQAAVRKQHHWNLTIFSDRSSLSPEVSLSETASSPQSPYLFANNQISIARTFTSMSISTFHRFQYPPLCDTML
ncbi:MAG: hypothetical protein OSJ60_20610, partial [Lachnospiraceae bacterium]|nr:hypothetical protein [Lachnospiraceae bacterium]